jgi:hypothetical protein
MAVAVQQIILSHHHDLSPWKGGGFGMFASVDMPTHRIIRGYFVDGGRSFAMDLAAVEGLERPLEQALALPTPGRLDRLAVRLARIPWHLDAQSRVARPLRSRSDAGTAPIRASSIRLEVYRIAFDRATLTVERRFLADVTRDLK